VLGPQHEEQLRKKKDEEQASLLRDMGYFPVSLPISIIKNEFQFNQTMYDLFVNGHVTNNTPPNIVLWDDIEQDAVDQEMPMYQDAMNELNEVGEYLDQVLG
jgi:hypothetical protein